MKRTFLAKLLGISSGAMLFAYGVMLACGGDWDFDYVYTTNLTPELFVPEPDRPMILSQNLFYGTRESQPSFHDQMIEDWTKYLGEAADQQAVSFFLLESSRVVIDTLANKKKTVGFKGKFDASSKKAQEFMRFLHLAKKVESASVNTDYWSYDPIEYKTFDDEKAMAEIENIYKSTQDVFLKKRYWFQTIKAYFYSADKARAIKFFDQTSGTVSKDWLYYRALSYVAGVHYKNKEYARANYLFSIVFDKSPALRRTALFNFHPQEQSDWQQTLAMTKNKDEKAAVWAMQGYYGDELEAIKEIYSLKPKSTDLEFLLSRLVNKVEYNSSFSTEQWESGQEFGIKSVEAASVVSKIAKDEKTAKPHLWHMAAGYLNTIVAQYDGSSFHYQKAEAQIADNAMLQVQLRLFRLVDAISQLDQIDSQTENRLLPELRWLLLDFPGTGNEEFRRENAVRWVRSTLSGLYQKAENPVCAELYVRKGGFYRNPDHLKAMKAFMEKSYWTPYQSMLLDLYNLRQRDIYHFEAVTATLDNKIADAISLMQKAGELKDAELLGDPFLGNIQDCHDCDHIAVKKRSYTHIQFLEEIQKKQLKIRNLEDVYTNSLLLGNAFYNLTHFGNARTFYEDDIFTFWGYEYSGDDRMDNQPMQDVFNCTIARKYYEQALKYAKNDEQRARCHYMLAKCERNDYYNEALGLGGTFWYGEGKAHFLAWDGFVALKKYSKTKFYRDVLNECGYFKTYIEKH